MLLQFDIHRVQETRTRTRTRTTIATIIFLDRKIEEVSAGLRQGYTKHLYIAAEPAGAQTIEIPGNVTGTPTAIPAGIEPLDVYGAETW
ncbi:hypothetical protein BH18THE2_BH18THE2_21290 [soil metagenome]